MCTVRALLLSFYFLSLATDFKLLMSAESSPASIENDGTYANFILRNNKEINDALLNGNWSATSSLVMKGILEHQLRNIPLAELAPTVYVSITSRSDNTTEMLAQEIAQKSYRILNDKFIRLNGNEQTEADILEAINSFFSVFNYGKQLDFLEKKRRSLELQEKQEMLKGKAIIESLRKKVPDYDFSLLFNLLDEWRAADYLFIMNQTIIYTKTIIPFAYVSNKKKYSVNDLLSLITKIDNELSTTYFPELTRPDIQKRASLATIKKFLKTEALKELTLAKQKFQLLLKKTQEKVITLTKNKSGGQS